MVINAYREDIEKALDTANKLFDGNLMFNNFQRLSDTRYRVTLRVKNSHGKGARLSVPRYTLDPKDQQGKQRRLINACWHAHGEFFDALPEGTRIQARDIVTYPGAEWQDSNIGSMMFPYYFSDACEC